MGRLYEVTLYYETGFNSANIPDSPDVLALAEKKTFNAIYRRQNYYLSTIRLDGTIDDFQDADYAQAGNAFYFVVGIDAVSDNTVQLTLQIDPISTIGGVGMLNVIGGWLKRAHPKTDEPFENMMGEPWAPRRPLQIKFKRIVNQYDDNTKFITIIASTVDLSKINPYARVLKPAQEEGNLDTYMMIPQYPPPPEGSTTLVLQDPDAVERRYKLPSICLYAYLDAAKPKLDEALANVRGLGIDSAIIAQYLVPELKFDVQYFNADLGSIKGLRYTTKFAMPDGDGPNPIYADVKNKKAVCLHNTIAVSSIVGADSATYDTADLVEPDGKPIRFLVSGDPAPGGSEIIRPAYFQGELTSYTEQAVRGGAWRNAGMTFQGGSGGMLSLANYNRNARLGYEIQQRTLQKMENVTAENLIQGSIDTVQGAVNGVGNIIGGAVDQFNPLNQIARFGAGPAYTGGISQIAAGANQLVDAAQTGLSTYYGYQNNLLDIGNQQTTYRMHTQNALWDAIGSANIVAPEISFPQEPGLINYFGNAFLIVQVGLHPDDVVQFDKFLTANGYSTSEQYYPEVFIDRQKFNFVQFSDVQLGAKCSMIIRRMAEDVLKSGVRIWHKLATSADYDDNPRRS